MGCLIANITKEQTLSSPRTHIKEKVDAKVDIATLLLEAFVKAQQRIAASTFIGERIQAKVGVVCSVPNKFILLFTKKGLKWEGETNNEGVVLYNTLISTGEWTLEEIVLEELL